VVGGAGPVRPGGAAVGRRFKRQQAERRRVVDRGVDGGVGAARVRDGQGDAAGGRAAGQAADQRPGAAAVGRFVDAVAAGAEEIADGGEKDGRVASGGRVHDDVGPRVAAVLTVGGRHVGPGGTAVGRLVDAGEDGEGTVGGQVGDGRVGDVR